MCARACTHACVCAHAELCDSVAWLSLRSLSLTDLDVEAEKNPESGLITSSSVQWPLYPGPLPFFPGSHLLPRLCPANPVAQVMVFCPRPSGTIQARRWPTRCGQAGKAVSPAAEIWVGTRTERAKCRGTHELPELALAAQGAWVEARVPALEETLVFRSRNMPKLRRGLCWKTPDVRSGTPGLGVHASGRPPEPEVGHLEDIVSVSGCLLSAQPLK